MPGELPLVLLALVAERVRFSAQDVQAENLDESISRGRELLDRLNASPPR